MGLLERMPLPKQEKPEDLQKKADAAKEVAKQLEDIHKERFGDAPELDTLSSLQQLFTEKIETSNVPPELGGYLDFIKSQVRTASTSGRLLSSSELVDAAVDEIGREAFTEYQEDNDGSFSVFLEMYGDQIKEIAEKVAELAKKLPKDKVTQKLTQRLNKDLGWETDNVEIDPESITFILQDPDRVINSFRGVFITPVVAAQRAQIFKQTKNARESSSYQLTPVDAKQAFLDFGYSEEDAEFMETLYEASEAEDGEKLLEEIGKRFPEAKDSLRAIRIEQEGTAKERRALAMQRLYDRAEYIADEFKAEGTTAQDRLKQVETIDDDVKDQEARLPQDQKDLLSDEDINEIKEFLNVRIQMKQINPLIDRIEDAQKTRQNALNKELKEQVKEIVNVEGSVTWAESVPAEKKDKAHILLLAEMANDLKEKRNQLGAKRNEFLAKRQALREVIEKA